MNPFPNMSALQQVELQSLVQLAKSTYERGWNFATAGNFSIRGSGRLMWQSPSGVMKGRLNVQGFIPVDIDTLTSPRPEAGKPSDETPLHAAVYRHFPETKAVMHVHSPFVVKNSLKHDALHFKGQEMGKVFGAIQYAEEITVPIIDNTQDMTALGKKFPKVIAPQIPALVLRGHGVYAWGRNPERVLAYLEGLEFLCQTHY